MGVPVPGRGSSLTLVPFTEDLLLVVQPWFHHPEVRRRLGGPQWPVRELQLLKTMPGEEYRGAVLLRAHSWVALTGAGDPVAKIGGDVYDRWVRYDGARPDRPLVTAVEPGPAMALTFVVDPARWGHGVGRGVLRAAVGHGEVADVRVFAAGIDADNRASQRCAAAAGFSPDLAHLDWENTVYYLLRRPDAGAAP